MFHCQVELPALQMARIGQEFFRHCSAPMAFDPVKGRYLKVDSVTNSCARRRTVGHRWFEPGFKIPTSMLSFYSKMVFPKIHEKNIIFQQFLQGSTFCHCWRYVDCDMPHDPIEYPLVVNTGASLVGQTDEAWAMCGRG